MVQAVTLILYLLYIGIMAYVIAKNYEKEKRLKEIRERFLLIIHDIKNYCTNMNAASQLLRATVNNSYGDLKINKISNYIDVIGDNCKEMNGLIESISKIIKLQEYHEMNISTQEDVVALINEAIKLSKFYAKKKNVALEVNAKWPEKFVEMDRSKFIRILSNLIINGIKYSNENGKALISTDEEDEWIKISVKDNGKGMSKQELSQIFNKYYSGNNHKDETDISLGVGLYGVKQLAKNMGGRIEVRSTEGKGSEFTLALPLRVMHRKNVLRFIIPNGIFNRKTSV